MNLPLEAWAQSLSTVLEAAATLAFALSGIVAAARKKFDAVGVCLVAGMAAFGGGTLRDLLLDVRPFFWVQHSAWLWGILVLTLVSMAWMQKHHLQLTERGIALPDALGLGLFTAVGVVAAHRLQQPAIVCVLMGVLTSGFGGVLRDIVCNEVPSAFADHQPYMVWSFLGGWLLLGLLALGLATGWAMLASACVVSGLRLLGLKYQWRLPEWRIY